jgi:hypothetical protein
MEQLGHKDHLGASRDEVSEDDGRATGGVQVLSAPAPVRVASEVRRCMNVVVMVRVTVGTMLRGRRVVDHSGYSARRRATISSGTVVCAGPKVRIRRFWRLVRGSH